MLTFMQPNDHSHSIMENMVCQKENEEYHIFILFYYEN